MWVVAFWTETVSWTYFGSKEVYQIKKKKKIKCGIHTKHSVPNLQALFSPTQRQEQNPQPGAACPARAAKHQQYPPK